MLNHKALRRSFKLVPKGLWVLEPIITGIWKCKVVTRTWILATWQKKSQNSNDEKETKFRLLINVLTSHAAKLLKVAFHGPRVVDTKIQPISTCSLPPPCFSLVTQRSSLLSFPLPFMGSSVAWHDKNSCLRD